MKWRRTARLADKIKGQFKLRRKILIRQPRRKKEISMARVPDIAAEQMTAEQRRVYNEIGGARGGIVAGPFAIWLRNPEIADRANQFGNVFRVGGKLGKRLFELMVLVVARHWS